MVHPSLLFLFEPIKPQALIYNVVFFGTANPSITYPKRINSRNSSELLTSIFNKAAFLISSFETIAPP
jgi:hypothetical protein